MERGDRQREGGGKRDRGRSEGEKRAGVGRERGDRHGGEGKRDSTSERSSEQGEDSSGSQCHVFTGSKEGVYETSHERCVQSILGEGKERG